jgi:hypothetical protein
MELNVYHHLTKESAEAFCARVMNYSVVQLCFDDRPKHYKRPWVVFYG